MQRLSGVGLAGNDDAGQQSAHAQQHIKKRRGTGGRVRVALELIIDFSGFLGGDFALVDEIDAALGVLGRAHIGPDERAAVQQLPGYYEKPRGFQFFHASQHRQG